MSFWDFSFESQKKRERVWEPGRFSWDEWKRIASKRSRLPQASAKIVAGKLFAYSIFRMSNHEYDFHVSKVLKTLQENTDPQNLVRATNQVLAKFNQHVAGALTIAQV
jgi:hypothetical protein